MSLESSLIMGFEISPREKIPNFFNSSKSKITEILANPGTTRYGGWSLETLDVPKIKKGEYYEVMNGDRKIVRLYNDATVVAIVDTGPAFLGHAMSQYTDDSNKLINPIALVEFIYNFVDFTFQVISEIETKEGTLKYKLKTSARTSSDYKIGLPENAGSMFFGSDPSYINLRDLKVNFSKFYDGHSEKKDIDEIAYDITEQVYSNFGIDSKYIPFYDSSTKEFKLDEIKKR